MEKKIEHSFFTLDWEKQQQDQQTLIFDGPVSSLTSGSRMVIPSKLKLQSFKDITKSKYSHVLCDTVKFIEHQRRKAILAQTTNHGKSDTVIV